MYKNIFIIVCIVFTTCMSNAKLNNNELFEAIRSSNIILIKKIVHDKKVLKTRNENNETPLYFAVKQNNFEIVKLLIELGADVKNDLTKESPLICSITMNNENIARLLIQNGANVNSSDGFGLRPLHYTPGYNMYSISKLLLRYGADVKAESSEKDTPLHTCSFLYHAKSYNSKKDFLLIPKLYIKHGANPNAKNIHGETPLDLAKRKLNNKKLTSFQKRDLIRLIKLLKPLTKK